MLLFPETYIDTVQHTHNKTARVQFPDDTEGIPMQSLHVPPVFVDVGTSWDFLQLSKNMHV